MDTFVISGLVRKRAELAGEIETAQAKLHQMISDLENLDRTILLFDADYQIAAIKPKGFRPPEDWAQRGEMSRIILNTLRQATEPLTTRDICLQLMTERALDTNNVKLVRLMTKRCGVSLRIQRDRGVVRSAQGPGQYHTWKIAR